MPKIIVLGCGLIGSTIAKDLSHQYHVTVVDKDEEKLKISDYNDNLFAQQADLSEDKTIKKLIQDYTLVIGAVPGFMGFKTAKSVIEAGKNMVDISFFPEDAADLNELAVQNKVMAIMDCGVAPGLSNMILGHHSTNMELLNFKCYVGGLPKIKTPPFEYKAPFSPLDVIEEYIRPARFKENNEIVIKEALSDLEQINFEKVGMLEAFNTDGLRSLLTTIDCPNQIEKTLRYPGHIEKIKFLKDADFFSETPVKVGKEETTARKFTSKILFHHWELKPKEEEFTIMKVEIEGKENEKPVKYEYLLYDEYNKETGDSSMARTTGFTCTAVVNMILKEKLKDQFGVIPPENIAKIDGLFDELINHLKERNVNIDKKVIS